jgi:hypothetical protein
MRNYNVRIKPQQWSESNNERRKTIKDKARSA